MQARTKRKASASSVGTVAADVLLCRSVRNAEPRQEMLRRIDALRLTWLSWKRPFDVAGRAARIR